MQLFFLDKVFGLEKVLESKCDVGGCVLNSKLYQDELSEKICDEGLEKAGKGASTYVVCT